MRTVYLDGKFIPESEAKLSIYDLSVMQAAAAFEMTRSFNGVHFKLREHLERLWDSCTLLNIPWPSIGINGDAGGLGTLSEICDEVSARNDHGPGEEHRLLIVVSPGCAPMYKDLEGVIPHPFVYIADFPLRYTVAGFSRYFTEGVHAVTSAIRQAPDDVLPSAAKHRSRLHFHLAQTQAPPNTWPILTVKYGDNLEVAEAPGANVVYVDHGQVYTVGASCLGGISMQAVKDLIPTREDFGTSPKMLATMGEIWLTGTPFCMLPVVSLDGKPIGDGKPGPVYQETLAKWSKLVGVDIQQQIIDWDNQTFLKGTVWTPDQQRILEARAQQLEDCPYCTCGPHIPPDHCVSTIGGYSGDEDPGGP